MPRSSTAAPSGLLSSHAPLPSGCSLFAVLLLSSPSTLRSFGSCFSVACGCICHLLQRDAAVGVRLMPWVITSLPALGLVFSGGHGVDRLNVQLLGSAVRLVLQSPHVLVRDLNLRHPDTMSAASR